MGPLQPSVARFSTGSKIDLKNFQPVGTFPMPEYESQTLAFPPFLEIFEYIERHRFNELIISTPGPMGLTGLAAARLLGLRTTGIYHTDFVQYVRHLTQDDDLADLTWQYMRWFYDQCTTILVPTETYRRQLIDNGFEPSKLGVMARGVDTQLFHPSKAAPTFFDRYGQANRFHFLYVGRISKEKNVDALIDAFDEILRRGYQASLVFVGDGPHRQPLAARCQDRPIAFTGMLEGEELARAYASGDCMVFPSTTDTFGNVVLEAQASGLPVIVTDQGGPAEIVRRHDSGIVVDLSQPQALADAMEKILLDADLRRELRSRGLRNAAESKWENVLEEFWSRDEGDSGEIGHGNLSFARCPQRARRDRHGSGLIAAVARVLRMGIGLVRTLWRGGMGTADMASLEDDGKEATMSLRPSRIHRIRKRGAWRKQFRLESDACPSELPRLPACPEDEEADGSSCDRPGGRRRRQSSTRRLGRGSALPGEAAGGREVPVKLRHLKVAAERGHLEAMYLLAQECDDRVARIHWLTMAAERGHVPAMHDLGLASAALHERRRWLLRAARHGWAEAMAELGDVECS